MNLHHLIVGAHRISGYPKNQPICYFNKDNLYTVYIGYSDIGYSDNFGRLEMSPLNSHTNFIGYSDIIYWISYILKLNDFCFFCLSELIEELVRATDLKFGMRVEYVLSRNKF